MRYGESFATDVGFNVCNDALQLHGGYGYIKEYPLERHFRDVRVHQILEGTNEIMRVIGGRRLLSDEKCTVVHFANELIQARFNGLWEGVKMTDVEPVVIVDEIRRQTTTQ